MTRRARDVAVSALALVLLAPLMLLVAVTIGIVDGLPVLFRQSRPGLHGQLFTLVKFRTMRVPRPDENPLATDGLRLGRLGRFLRATSLDELPTLWNVLRGDMSLVGPRPLLPEYLSRFTREQARRHEVRPGVTGWAQVHGRNGISWDDRLRMDTWYVDHWTHALDARILLMTLWQVVSRRGVSASGHATMPEFQGDARSAGPSVDRQGEGA